MKTHLVRIGNSRGIRIPKAIIEECGLSGEVELEVGKEGSLVIRPLKNRRSGWSLAFARMKKHGDDRLLDGDSSTSAWDEREWRW